MSASERSPLLSPEDEDGPATAGTETSPLLGHRQDRNSETDQADGVPSPSASASASQPSPWYRWRRSNKPASKSKLLRNCRWASITAIIVLAVLVVCVMLLGFFLPAVLQKYTEAAAVIEPTGFTVESITPNGVRARIQANFRLESSRVEDDSVRRIGGFSARVVGKLATESTNVSFYLPQYNNALLGTAVVPRLDYNVLDGHTTQMDFMADLGSGESGNIRKIANDWMRGKLKKLEVTGAALVEFKTGIIPLGTHDLATALVFEADEIPAMPEYQIQRLQFHDIPAGDGGSKAIGANVSITVPNDYPIALNVPSLGFEILVPNCDASEPYIMVAEAVTNVIHVRPNSNVTADASGVISELSDTLTRACPPTKLSPLDHFMQHYLHGEGAEVFVRAQKTESSDTPEWINNIIKNITVPLELPGKSFGNMIRNFSLSDVDFQLPSPFADPSDPDSQPRVSGLVQVLAALPPEVNVDIGVKGIQSNADLFYEKLKFGELNLDEWQKAQSTKLIENDETLLNITAKVVDVPLKITDGDVFGDLMQAMLFGIDDIMLDVKASVNVKVSTVLGNVVVKEVPAEGKIPVKPLPGNSLSTLEPHVADLQILNTSETSLLMQASVNFTNPTPYTAFIPYVNAHLLKDGHMIAEVIARDVDLRLGNKTNFIAQATWDPLTFGGTESHEASRRFLSDYVSRKNTTITLRTHRDSIPKMPLVGEALSKINLTLPAPRLKLPSGDGDDEEQNEHFVREATFHILSSTASFILASPLHRNTIYLDFVNATALYNHTEPIGQIVHDKPFAAPPGLSLTPRLGVEWSPSHVGFDKVKNALGGSLKLDTTANVTIRLGNWVENLQYEGKGIGAKVRL